MSVQVPGGGVQIGIVRTVGAVTECRRMPTRHHNLNVPKTSSTYDG